MKNIIKYFGKILLTLIVLLSIGGGLTGCSSDAEKIKSLQHLELFHPVKNVLVLGNSITLHGKCSYWWGEWGMAASEKAKDYVHIFENISKCKTDVMNYYQWEIMHNDRAETYNLIEPYFARKYDLVVLQLGENISNTDTLEQDFCDLIKHIQGKLNDVRIIVLGNFWKNKKIEKIKQNVCDGKQVAYIDLGDLQDKQYSAGLGAEVKGDDGMTHIIEHKGVANHPGDRAMQIVAERIFAIIR